MIEIEVKIMGIQFVNDHGGCCLNSLTKCIITNYVQNLNFNIIELIIT